MRWLCFRAGVGVLALALALGACGDASNNNDNLSGTAEALPGISSTSATSP